MQTDNQSVALEAWLEELNSKRKVPLDAIDNQRLSLLSDWMRYSQVETPDELIAEYDGKPSLNKIGNRLYKWVLEIPKVSEGSKRTYGMRIAGFYTANGIKLNTNKINSLRPFKSKKEVMLEQREADFWTDGRLSNIVVSFLDKLPMNIRTLSLCMISSGLDAQDFLKLEIGEVHISEDDDTHFFEGFRSKEEQQVKQVQYRTFISKEATEFLRRYISTYRKNAAENEPLFVNESGEALTLQEMNHYLRKAARNVGIANGGRNPLSSKTFRHFFAQAAKKAGVSKDIIGVFLGHVRSITETYTGEEGRTRLRTVYEKIEPFVTVYSVYVENTESKTLKEQVNKLEQRLDYKDADIASMEGRIQELSALVNELLKKED